MQSSAEQCHHKQYKSGNYNCWPYRWLVRWPGEEDPLVSLRVFGVQAVEDVAGFLRCEQRKQERIVILVPALLWFSVPVQHQLLCREKRTAAQLWPAFWTRPIFSFLYRSWWRSSVSWRRLPSPELGSLWVEVLLRQPDIGSRKVKTEDEEVEKMPDRAGCMNPRQHFRETIWSTDRQWHRHPQSFMRGGFGG